jgi:hypothetical protein
MRLLLRLFALATAASAAHGAREISSADGRWRASFEARMEAEVWHMDTPPPGLVQFDGDTFFQPRLVLSLDLAAGDAWWAHVETRWDRGFDAGAREEGEFRVDEAFLRWRPLGDERLSVQAGKFATVFGHWVARHQFFDNAFLDAPLPYHRMHGIKDRRVALSNATVLGHRNEPDNKPAWLPVIWGPAYATGVAIFGALGHFDYALELKNAALAARPDTWSPWQEYFDHPTVAARLGWRPSATWALGLSASRGAYLLDEAQPALPRGAARDDYPQTVLGADARWAWRQFQVWAEVLGARFETPFNGDLDILSYYLEGRWKVNASLWVAARWGQQFFSELEAADRTASWDRDAWRAEIAFGVKIAPDVLLKAQYSHTHEAGGGVQGENAVGLGIGWRF